MYKNLENANNAAEEDKAIEEITKTVFTDEEVGAGIQNNARK